MSPRSPGLTREQHVALGAELFAMHDRLTTISVELSRAYPQPLANQADKVIAQLGKLRSKLDDVVFREYPEGETKDIARIYYPGRGTDREP